MTLIDELFNLIMSAKASILSMALFLFLDILSVDACVKIYLNWNSADPSSSDGSFYDDAYGVRCFPKGMPPLNWETSGGTWDWRCFDDHQPGESDAERYEWATLNLTTLDPKVSIALAYSRQGGFLNDFTAQYHPGASSHGDLYYNAIWGCGEEMNDPGLYPDDFSGREKHLPCPPWYQDEVSLMGLPHKCPS